MTSKTGVDVVIKMLDVPISTYVPIRTYIGTQLMALFGELMETRKGSPSGRSGIMLVDIENLSTLLLDLSGCLTLLLYSWEPFPRHTFLPMMHYIPLNREPK